MWLLFAACSPETVSPALPVAPPEVRRVVPGVVASIDLPAGHVIGTGDLQLGEVPDFAPEPATDLSPWLGRTVREPILAGEPFRGERTAPGTGWDALVETGVALTLSVPRAAVVGVGPGCTVEVVRVGDPGQRPRLAVADPVRVLGLVPGDADPVGLVVESPAPISGPVTIVVVQRAAAEENPSSPVFVAPARPGRPLAVARHALLPGVFVRSADLGEVGGEGLEGLSLTDVWARTPHQRILPGELVRAERLATDTTGLCVKIPDGLRAVSLVAAPGAASPDLVETRVTIRSRGHELRDLHVLAVDGDVLTVVARPDLARAVAVVAASGEAFAIGR